MDFALCTRYDERTTRTSLLGLHTASEYSTEFRGQQWKRSKARTLSRGVRWAQYQARYALGTIQYIREYRFVETTLRERLLLH